jgi:hypothetical protein
MIILGLLMGAFFPRLLFILLWATTNLVDRAYTGFILPFISMLFLPFTSLFYILAYNSVTQGLTSIGWVWVFLGFLIDISSYTYNGYKGSHHQPHTA